MEECHDSIYFFGHNRGDIIDLAPELHVPVIDEGDTEFTFRVNGKDVTVTYDWSYFETDNKEYRILGVSYDNGSDKLYYTICRKKIESPPIPQYKLGQEFELEVDNTSQLEVDDGLEIVDEYSRGMYTYFIIVGYERGIKKLSWETGTEYVEIV